MYRVTLVTSYFPAFGVQGMMKKVHQRNSKVRRARGYIIS